MSTDKTQAEQLPQDAVMQSVLKQNDCRYGNYIIYGGSVTQLNEKEMCHFFRFPETYNPILITEEWLLKFGFTETYKKGYFVLELEDDSYLFFNNHARGYAIEPTEDDGKTLYTYTPLTYVHQLQNLYFALTGSELTVA